MKYSITIEDMTTDELASIVAFIKSQGAVSVAAKTRQTVAELAAATGVTPSAPPAPPQAAPYVPPVPGAPAADPFAAPVQAPPVTQAPAAPPAPAPQVSTTAEVDARGVPYNAAYYADSKRQTKAGAWARRKNVDATACDAWEARFVGKPGAPTADDINAKFAPGLPPQGQTTQPVADPFAAPAQVPPVPQADPFAAPPVPTPAAPPAPPAPEIAEVTYAEWYRLYQNLLTAGKMTPEWYADLAKRHGADIDETKFFKNDEARRMSYLDMMALANS